MSRFTIYTYQFKPINAPVEMDLFRPDVDVEESMRNKQDIFGCFFLHDSKLRFKYNNQEFDYHVVAQHGGIIVLKIANNSKLIHESNFNRWEEEDHPSLYVIIDNRKDKQIVAIENRQLAFSDTTTVARIMAESFDRLLLEHGLEVSVDAKYHRHEFWEIVTECGNGVASVKFKFPYPNLPAISDLVGEYYTEVARRTNGEPTTILTARAKERLILERGDLLVENMISAASASGKLIMMRPKGQRKWKQIGLRTIVHEELSDQVLNHLEENELIPHKWYAIVSFLDRIKNVYD
ncbi:MAG: hypothetical protein K2J86_02690 [Prevotella sp.]|nr:hypothetical protein [Prevotella sp.]